MTIYIDLDGVLVNFKKKCEQEKCFKQNGKANWDKIDSLGKDFWTQMEWMPGAQEFYNKVLIFANRVGWKIKILSAIHSEAGREGKTEWCQKNLALSKSNIKIVPKAKDKLKYANPFAYLIDDKKDVVDSFNYAGGTAILYESAELACKKFDLLIEAVEELEAAGCKEDVNNPTKLLDARLRNLFRKCDPKEWKMLYKDVLTYGHMVLFNHPSLEAAEYKSDDDPDILNEKFAAIKSFIFEVEQIIDSFSDLKKPDIKWNQNKLDNSLGFFYLKTYKHLGERFLDAERKCYFDQILNQFKTVHGISLLKDVTQTEASSILLFAYLTTLGNYLVERFLMWAKHLKR